jgi:hypothetical protein
VRSSCETPRRQLKSPPCLSCSCQRLGRGARAQRLRNAVSSLLIITLSLYILVFFYNFIYEICVFFYIL